MFQKVAAGHPKFGAEREVSHGISKRPQLISPVIFAGAVDLRAAQMAFATTVPRLRPTCTSAHCGPQPASTIHPSCTSRGTLQRPRAHSQQAAGSCTHAHVWLWGATVSKRALQPVLPTPSHPPLKARSPAAPPQKEPRSASGSWCRLINVRGAEWRVRRAASAHS